MEEKINTLIELGFFEWTGWYYFPIIEGEYTLCYAPNDDLFMINIDEKTIRIENITVEKIKAICFALFDSTK